TRLGSYAEMFGLGRPTGIDLPGELAGLVPDERWKRLNYSEIWLTGDTYNMAVGQGFVLATPLQMLNAYAAVANGGTLYRPHLVKEISDSSGNLVKVFEPEVIGQLDVSPAHLQLIRAGLRGVINWERGTAYDTFDVPGIDASGKTGTAEFCDEYPQCLDRDGRVQTSHAWFAAYAPSNNPEIVTIVFVYGGDEGSQTSVPVANKILRHYFGIDDGSAEDEPAVTEDNEAPIEPLTPAFNFQARLLGADGLQRGGAAITGFVIDSTALGLAGIEVELVANGEVVDRAVSGQNGQFDFIDIEPDQTAMWQVRLPAYPAAPPLLLEVAEGLRYLVEFEAQSPTETQPDGEASLVDPSQLDRAGN
ncbi:MAG: penicillin-binding transpeptidase domain-containing protein, partial [Anaerolineae bacterium]|nr:penicillin-binding transpeptidase domain-containing protein [Anaerolineae bacterium]